ncbi:MAG: hypothetical protein NTY22_01990 [Proteobacteria bacterium]|nr:hypothetical protein [Pseudomonadota bacterium]
MAKTQNKKMAKILTTIAILLLAGFLIFELIEEKPRGALFAGKIPSISYIELNLKVLKQYNTPTGSVISDFGDLLAGRLSAPEYSILRYDLTSSLFLVLLPLIAMFGILMALGVSKRTLTVIMVIFGVFTVLPLILI